MKHNVGTADRIVRAVLGVGVLASSIVGPVPLVFGAMGGYLVVSAVAGSCLGYRLMGQSTCPR